MTTLPVPDGHVADVITHLEMASRPAITAEESTLTLERWNKPAPEKYLALFRKIGERWMWLSRLLLSEDELTAIIHHPGVAIYQVQQDGQPVGFIELDFREAKQCEIGFLGLIPELNGRGHGRWLMNVTLTKAWRPDVQRVWLHTCTLDSPRALPYYCAAGFTAFKREVSMNPDPRLTGHLPKTAGPHIPIIS